MPLQPRPPVIPTQDDRNIADVALELLQRSGRPMRLSTDESSETVELPKQIVDLFHAVLRHMSAGHAVAIHPVDQELSTQTAANLLRVSRPFLIKLLDEGKLPFTKVNRHRRIRLQDLLTFKAQFKASQKQSLEELADLGKEIDV